nr:hypothetical protein [uncultured Arsenicibacter sp.]
MKMTVQKLAVTHALHMAGTRLLDKSPLKTLATAEAAKLWRQKVQTHSDGEIQEISAVSDSIHNLTTAMARCQSPEMLQIMVNYSQAVLDGKVMITDDDEIANTLQRLEAIAATLRNEGTEAALACIDKHIQELNELSK